MCDATAASLPLPGERDDDLVVVVAGLQRVGEPGERDAPGDQPLQPGEVRLRERVGGRVVVAQVGVDAADHHVVVSTIARFWAPTSMLSVRLGVETPVRQAMPYEAVLAMASNTTDPAPVA